MNVLKQQRFCERTPLSADVHATMREQPLFFSKDCKRDLQKCIFPFGSSEMQTYSGCGGLFLLHSMCQSWRLESDDLAKWGRWQSAFGSSVDSVVVLFYVKIWNKSKSKRVQNLWEFRFSFIFFVVNEQKIIWAYHKWTFIGTIMSLIKPAAKYHTTDVWFSLAQLVTSRTVNHFQ